MIDMSLSLYVDVHVAASITVGLRQRGLDVITAQDDGRSRASDEELLERASDLGRLFFTQDNDVFAIASQWQLDGAPFYGVVYAHQLAAGIGALIRDLELV